MGRNGQFMSTYVFVGPRNTVLRVGQVMLSCWWVRPRYVNKMMNINQDQHQEPCYTRINSILLAARIAKMKGNAVTAVLRKD